MPLLSKCCVGKRIISDSQYQVLSTKEIYLLQGHRGKGRRHKYRRQRSRRKLMERGRKDIYLEGGGWRETKYCI
jgi:hypothetical protein